MTTPTTTRLAFLAAAALLAVGAQASNFSKPVYNGAKDDIKAAYQAEREQCKALAGNTKDVCIEEAKAREHVALARLDYDYSGTSKDQLAWATASYEGRYKVAMEKCDDLAGNAKDVCHKEAKGERDKAKANVKMVKEVREAVGDAEHAKMEADYKVAKERCDALSGDAKDICVASAKARYPS